MTDRQEELLENELDKVNLAIEKLQKFEQRSPESKMQDLPEDTLKLVKSIKIMPPYSSTGLEDITYILDDLYMSRYVIEKSLNGPEQNEQENTQAPRSNAEITQNQQGIPAPRPRPKVLEQSNTRTQEQKPIANSPSTALRTDKKPNAVLVNLQDVAHITPPTPKQTATPNIPPKKQDPLDPFEQ